MADDECGKMIYLNGAENYDIWSDRIEDLLYSSTAGVREEARKDE